jgi:mono/diheme cytochrome c family protein
MSTKRKLAWTAIVLMPVVVIGALALAARNVAMPNIEWPTQMMRTPASEPYTRNAVLRGRMTMQPSVPGTVARGSHLFPYGAGPAEAERAGRELVDPLTVTPAGLARGRKVFTDHCAVCHGATGKGDGPIIPKYPNPPSFHTEKSRSLPDGTIFHVITMGRNNMPPHGPLVTFDDRWRLVQYIRTLQKEG